MYMYSVYVVCVRNALKKKGERSNHKKVRGNRLVVVARHGPYVYMYVISWHLLTDSSPS